jgi:hypothetical protein
MIRRVVMKHLFFALVLLPFLAIAPGIDDHLASMKTTKAAVQDFIQSDIGYGSFSYPPACALIPPQKRVAVVRAVGEFARAFSKTDAFQQWYASFRDEKKPPPPELTPSMEESRKKQIAEIKKSIAEQEKAQASASADQKGIFRDVLISLRTMLKEVEKSDPAQDAEMDGFIRQTNDQVTAEYKQKLEAYAKEYPAGNPRPLIKRRLEEFLKVTENVDFAARTVKKEDVWVFESSEYENKDGQWKTVYRVGKEATEAARAFARDWLKEL